MTEKVVSILDKPSIELEDDDLIVLLILKCNIKENAEKRRNAEQIFRRKSYFSRCLQNVQPKGRKSSPNALFE